MDRLGKRAMLLARMLLPTEEPLDLVPLIHTPGDRHDARVTFQVPFHDQSPLDTQI